MHDSKLRGKKIAVLGFGVESQETVEFLLKHGASVTVLDEKNEHEFDRSRLSFLEGQGVSFQFGPFDSLTDFDAIVRSPGVKPGIHALHEAGDLGIEITSATNIFLERAKGITVGITGTKGKGTTAALLYEMLKADGREVFLGGNIGVPMLSFADRLTGNSVSILELSSFQLMDALKSPQIAVVLMVTEDHMDYHLNRQEYIGAKMGIVRHQTRDHTVIVNRDYAASVKIAEQSFAKKIFMSARQALSEGCFVESGSVLWDHGGKKETIIATKDVLIPGKHNLENVCAAVAVAKLLKTSKKSIVDTLKTFRGLTHRLELAREVGGVRYYNDSISTTPDSALAAIRAFDSPEVLILGGSSKNSDFTELGKVISEAKNIKAIIGIGSEWPRIRSKVKSKVLKVIEDLKSMQEVIEKAHTLASAGDVVILSPACASFDMFKDYKDRGDQFKRCVNAL